MKECTNPDCAATRQALDAAVARAERLHRLLRQGCIDADAIMCVENDTRRDLGLEPVAAEDRR